MKIELSHQQAAYLRKFLRDQRNALRRAPDPRLLECERVVSEALGETVHDPLAWGKAS